MDSVDVRCPGCGTFFRPQASANPAAIFCPRCGRNVATADPTEAYERSNSAVGWLLGGCLVALLIGGGLVVGVVAWLFVSLAPAPAPPQIAAGPNSPPPPAFDSTVPPPNVPPGISENDGRRGEEAPPATNEPPRPPSVAPAPNDGSTLPRPGEPNPFDGPQAPIRAPQTPASPSVPPTSLPRENPKPDGGPPPTRPTNESGPRDPQRVRYEWKSDAKHFYTLVVGAKVDDVRRETRGGVLLTFSAVDPQRALDGTPLKKREEENAAGSAFFVTSDGRLITCAHVLQGATQIDVRYGGKLVPAKLLAQDHELDVALLQIETTDAPTLPLADSDQVQLAQEVRAVGFPLTDVLGESVKVTRGSVAGLVDQDDKRMLQIDAAINPGNSGGPIVDEQGRVVGVATAKLSGEEVSNVGFAVPSNMLLKWLRGQGVTPAEAPRRERLDGPDLAKLVTPAVALVNVRIGPGGVGAARQFVLNFSGHVADDERRDARDPLGRPQIPLPRLGQIPGVPRVDSGQVRVDAAGNVEEFRGREHLPCLFGPLALAPIEPLPPDGAKKWRVRRALTLTLESDADDARGGFPPGLRPRMPFGSPFGRPQFPRGPFDPFGREQEDERSRRKLAALETMHFEVVESTPRRLRVKKTSELKTVGDADEKISLQLTLVGEYVVDRELGVVERSTYEGKFVEKQGSTEKTLPVSWSLVRSDPPPAPNPAPGGAPAVPPPAAPQPPTDQEIDAFLADVRGGDEGAPKRLFALSRLAFSEPAEARRAEVVDTAIAFLKEPDASVRSNVVRVVVRWAGKEQVPQLLRLLDEVESKERFQVYLAFGSAKTADERLARKLVERLHSSDERSLAFQALRSQGATAEAALVEALSKPDLDSQAEFFICILLGEHGGEAALAALQASIAGRENDSKSFRRKSAASSIERRLKGAKP